MEKISNTNIQAHERHANRQANNVNVRKHVDYIKKRCFETVFFDCNLAFYPHKQKSTLAMLIGEEKKTTTTTPKPPKQIWFWFNT